MDENKKRIGKFEISDLLYNYLPISDFDTKEEFSRYINSRYEFSSVASSPTEQTPKRGNYYRHQDLVARIMAAYDYLLLMHSTGTGKGCSVGDTSESFKKAFFESLGSFVNGIISQHFGEGRFASAYLNRGSFGIRRVIFLAKGRTLTEEFRNQLYCVCSVRKDYELDETVMRAGGEKFRTGQLNKIVEKFYDILGYKKFYNRYERERKQKEKEGISEEEFIRQTYSNVLFVYEEADYIIPASLSESIRRKGSKSKKKKRDELEELEDELGGLEDEDLREQQDYESEEEEEGSADDSDSDEDIEDKESSKMSQGDKIKIYNKLLKINRTARNSKAMALTATPMRNTPYEMKPLMELLMDEGEMPDINYEKATYKDLKEYLGGRISFVRELDLRAKPVFITSKQEMAKKYNIYISVMSKFQKRHYLESKTTKSFDVSARQSSDIVLPDGKYGRDAEFEVFQATGKNAFRHEKIFKGDKFMKALKKSSCKYYTIFKLIKKVENENGLVFVYFDFRTSALLFSAAIEQMGYARYLPKTSFGDTLMKPLCVKEGSSSLPGNKAKRYSLITSEPYMSPTQMKDSLRTIRNFENRHGEYIKVVIVSVIGREGINIPNVIQGHIVNSGFNEASNYQATSRFLRSTSHDALISEKENDIIDSEIERLYSMLDDYELEPCLEQNINDLYTMIKSAIQGKDTYTQYTRRRKNLYMVLREYASDITKMKDPNEATIEVKIYRHAALYKEDSKLVKTIDYNMYALANKKDRKIRKMFRIMKRCAIDCTIHKNRNVRENDEDYSQSCDYQECDYKCIGGNEAIPTDYSAFDAVYYKTESENLIDKITRYISAKGTVRFQEIIKAFPSRLTVIEGALSTIVNSRKMVTDRLGNPGYIGQVGDILFVHQDHFDFRPSYTELEYSNFMTRNILLDYKLVVLDIHSKSVSGKIEKIYKEKSMKRIEELLSEIQTGMKALLLQNEIELYAKTEQDDNPVVGKLMKIYPNFIFPNYEEDLKLYEVTSTTSGGKIEIDKTDNRIIMHTLLSTDKSASYEMSSRAIQPSGTIAIYRIEQGNWIYVNPSDDTFNYYRAQAKQITEQRIREVIERGRGIFGTILHDGNFRISKEGQEITKEIDREKKIVAGKSTKEKLKDKRLFKYGRNCTNYNKYSLINVLYAIYKNRKTRNPNIKEDTITDMYVDIVSNYNIDGIKLNQKAKQIIENEDNYKEAETFFKYWVRVGLSTNNICNVIKTDFKKNNLIFVMQLY